MSRRGITLALALAGAAALAAPAAAGAYWGEGASIVSASLARQEQADDSSQFAAVSGDGRYVAIQTRARNFFADDDPDPEGQFRAGGVFRRDLGGTGAMELVADGDLRTEVGSALVRRGAQSPSVSRDGRFVAFATAQALVPGDGNGAVDIYVRDMTVPVRSPGAFDLVSARDGGDTAAAYDPPGTPRPGLDPGSDVTRGAAISADGRHVAFRTVAESDLPARPGTDTPADQVLVRDRTLNSTTLVTRASSGGAAAGGATGPARISADGSTVTWTGRNAAAQATFLNGESTEPSIPYYLWRRVADGPAAPTRRITGVADVDDPACLPGSSITLDSTATGPCYGPLTEPEAAIGADITGLLPTLSADGRRVAFLTGSGPRPNATTPAGLDLWVTDMSPRVSRKAGSRELTRDSQSGDVETSGAISSVSSSPDGRHLGVVTLRSQFVFRALTQVGSRRAVADARELYVIDVDARRIERAVLGAGGTDVNQSIETAVTLSEGANRLAFTSDATNLFFGDANDRSDAFAVTRQPEPRPAPPPRPVAPPPGANLEEDLGTGEEDELDVAVRRRRDGNVELTVAAPAIGSIKAVARGRVGVRRGRRGKTRTIATVLTRSRAAGRVRLVLKPVRRYRREVRRRRKVAARVAVAFVASKGGKRLSASRRVTFGVKAQRKRRRR